MSGKRKEVSFILYYAYLVTHWLFDLILYREKLITYRRKCRYAINMITLRSQLFRNTICNYTFAIKYLYI